MTPPTFTHTIQTTETATLRLTGRDILVALRIAGLLPTPLDRAKESVTFRVPGGGDWSNTTLDVDDDNPVVVQVVTEGRA